MECRMLTAQTRRLRIHIFCKAWMWTLKVQKAARRESIFSAILRFCAKCQMCRFCLHFLFSATQLSDDKFGRGCYAMPISYHVHVSQCLSSQMVRWFVAKCPDVQIVIGQPWWISQIHLIHQGKRYEEICDEHEAKPKLIKPYWQKWPLNFSEKS